MAAGIRSVKGTHDSLPRTVWRWHRMEAAARKLFRAYCYREIRTPIFEHTELFARSIGAETDIVAKEMYTFADRDGASLTLRPEATAGIVRAVIEHTLWQTDPAPRVFAIGPMFRRERPQKGRYRQFHQVNVEAFGISEPAIDAEMIEMALAYLHACGLSEDLDLVLNSVGDSRCRPTYVELLRAALRPHASSMCGDCQRRIETNTLRVLDCKVPQDQPIIDGLPKISDHLCAECAAHFGEVRRYLELVGIDYRLSHRLVRGLDYYTRTTFEVLAGGLGAQNAVLGGGRYDGLVKDLGGPDLTAIGFALGMERLGSLLRPKRRGAGRCDVFLATLGQPALDKALKVQTVLRSRGVRVLTHYEGKGLKPQMRDAGKLGAQFVAILGEEELASATWKVRDMAASAQEEVAESGFVDHIMARLRG